MKRAFQVPGVSLCCVLLSCSILFQRDGYVRRGSLCEAMDKASDDHEGERRVEDSEEREGRWWWWGADTSSEDRTLPHPAGVQSYTSPPHEQHGRPIAPPALDSLDSLPRDSSGRIDLQRYRVELSLPFVVPDSIDHIVLSASDTAGRKREYLIERLKTDSAAGLHAETSSNTAQTVASADWRVRERKQWSYAGLRIAGGLTYSSHYGSVTGVSFVWASHYDRQRRAALHAGAALLSAREDSDLPGSIRDLFQLHLGYQHRFYFTPDHTFAGIFVPVDFEVKSVFWKYRNDVFSQVYNERGDYLYTDSISSDGLWGVSLGSGIGLSLIQTRWLRLTGEASCGATLYGFRTHEGFSNDVFAADLLAKITVEIVFGSN